MEHSQDDTEKEKNRYFCTDPTNLIGPVGESQAKQVCSRETDPLTLTNITIRQREIEYKIIKLKGEKATGPDGVRGEVNRFISQENIPT